MDCNLVCFPSEYLFQDHIFNPIAIQHALPSRSPKDAHAGCSLILRVFLNLFEKREPAITLISSACRQNTDRPIVDLDQMRCRRGLYIWPMNGQPKKLIALEDLSLEFAEIAQPGSVGRALDQSFCQWPDPRNEGWIDTNKVSQESPKGTCGWLLRWNA